MEYLQVCGVFGLRIFLDLILAIWLQVDGHTPKLNAR